MMPQQLTAVSLFVLTLAPALAAGTPSTERSARQPNVIIIFSDDHGYTDLGIHDIDQHVDTPHMDALARGGALMKAGYSSAPQCRPSRCGLLTGRIQNEFGFTDNKCDAGAGEGTLPRVYPPGTDMAGKPLLTIAERMKRLGYATGFSGKWHCGLNVDPDRKLDPRGRGFDDYWVAPMTSGVANFDLNGKSIPHQRKSWPGENRVILQGKYAEAFVQKNKDRPFFLYLPIYGPHVPMIRTNDPYVKNTPLVDYPQYNDAQDEHRRLGLALIKAMDDAVGGLVATLQRYDLEQNTLILFAGDNGAPGRFDSAAIGAWNGSNNVPMRGPKGTLHEGGIRVPMFASWKGHLKSGTVIDEMVTTLDLTATALAVAGGEMPPEFDGVNLMPRLTGTERQINRSKAMYWDFYTGQAIREGAWKLWRNDDVTVLFNIADDPAELTNLAWMQPERVRQLTAKLDAWTDSLLPGARYDPAGRGADMPPHFAGAPAGIKPDPRYLIPYETPKAAPYPAAVRSPGAAKPEVWELEQPKPRNVAPRKPNQRSKDQFFRTRDRNNDGAITLEEFIGNPEGRNVAALTTRFKKLDANSDGKLQRNELK